MLAAGALAFASVAHSQVIEEGGFPVKGGGVSGESFSLSCPPRLVVEAGESVALSCSATDVPEEGVRYGWESLSGEGFYLLSASDELSPLFTAPLSGAGEEYAYRLTAMAAGVYRTATVTVSVEGVPGETIGAPIVREECDPFTVPEGLGEGCAEDKGPAPFGFGSEAEGGFLFPEAPGLPDRPSGPVRGGGSVMQAPPRLECPAAIFLEELETGSIECRVFDASGEEHLEYSWEPVGSTTRDYLENPRLIPEDSPTPSVVAPEAPAYETLESFRSVETTFRYRYRLTATSRATGLSSRTEVEVFVSGSRPGVYCPLEVAVEEGATIALDCEGADPLSSRMDYDADGASIAWGWEGLWGASTALLDATDRSSPLFTAPPGSAGEAYHYIASMTSQASGVSRTARRRVTVTVTEAGEEAVVGAVAGSDMAAPARGGPAADLQVTCNGAIYRPLVPLDNYYFYGVVETEDDFELDCEHTGGPAGATYTYSWTGPSDISDFLSDTNIRNPVFRVPDVPPDGIFQDIFTLLVEASVGSVTDMAEANVGVAVVDENHTLFSYTGSYFVDEGDPDFTMDIIPVGNGTGFSYPWTGSPEALALLSATNILTPDFSVPGDVPANTDYDYVLSVTRNSRPLDPIYITVTVRDVPAVPAITCSDVDVFEDAGDFELDCSVTNADGATYSWETLSGATDTSLLTGTDGPAPTFDVPTINAGTPADAVRTYEYGVTMSATGGSVSATVTITVRDKDVLCWVSETGKIQDLYEHTVDEGSEDRVLETCQGGVTGPGGPPYTYEWGFQGSSALGSAASLLTATDRQTVYFKVPGDVPRNTEYEISFKVFSASNPGNYDDALFRITVLNLDPVSCNDPPAPVLEGSAPFALDCEDTGAPAGVTWDWDPTDHLTNTGAVAPTFTPPEIDGGVEEFSYTVRALVGDASVGESEVTVDVLDRPRISVTCPGNPYGPYEGAGEITLNCSATGGVAGATYNYVWTPRGSTVVPGKLSSAAIRNPTFAVPENVSSPETYEYTLTVSSMDGMREKDGAFNVTVTVLDKPDIAIDCPGDPYRKYEGEEDFELDCSATGAPSGSIYRYVWTERGMTANTDNLIGGTDGPTPMFAVPEEVDAVETYEYLLTVSADNAESATEDVTVTVLNKAEITVTCTGNPYEAYEGADDITLDCSATGAPSGSDYDYVWTGRGGTADTDLLSATDGPTPTFDVPGSVDANTDYEYTLTVSAGESAKDGAFDVTVTVLDRPAIVVTCPGNPYGPYEGADDIVLDCEATGGPSGSTYDYAWTERGGTPDTALLIAGTDGPTPAFDVPESVDSDEPYYYTLTVSAENAEDGAFDVTVTVLDKPSITVTCPGDPYSKYEGEEDFDLDCSATGAPEDSGYDYVWTERGGTANTDLLIAGTDGPTPTFDVPESVDSNEPYEYLLTVSAENAESATAPVTVRVLNRATLALVCTSPRPVYEGSPDFDLNCSASGAPVGSGYDYVWTARGMTPNTALLIAGTDGPTPTFDVPESVDADTDYEYTLTVSAENAEDAAEDVTVTVLNRKTLDVACATPSPVYEGAADFALDCAATGAPAGSDYAYVWTARDATTNTDLLVGGTDGPAPIFDVPEEVDEDKTYEYLLRVSAENATDATAEVTVKVLKIGSIALVCASPPLVYEGSADFALDCSVSGDADYTYAWTARGATSNTARLSAADIPSPTFYVPDRLDATTTYEYLLTASAANAIDATAEVTVTVLNRGTLDVACAPPALVYEGAADFDLDCTASGAPAGSGYEYVWTARGSTANTDLLIAGADGPAPTFDVPDRLDATTTYEYLLTVGAENAESGSAAVTVTVLNHGALSVVCVDPPSVYEGSADITLDCTASGAPAGSGYEYVWTARGATANTDLLIAGADGPAPTFMVPDRLDATTTYEYLLTVGAENAESASAAVTVTVLNHGALSVVCVDPPSVYEGSADITLDCSASGAPAGSGYEYVWTARGSTANTDLLIAGADGPAPTFMVPDRLDATTTYEYLLTVGAENAESASAAVTVTVLNHGALSVVCVDPPSVYEGSADITLDCSASGAPAGSGYEYVWTARGSTANTALLIAGADGPTPTFMVPDRLDATTTYEYLLTVGAENAESASAAVTVTVLNHGALSVVCVDPPSVYEGSDDFALDCSASGAPAGSDYAYAWTARGSTANTDLLIAGADGPTPTFDVPDEVDETTTYEYLLTVGAENAESASGEVTVTVLNVGSLRVVCADPPSVYEGSDDFALDCSASGAPAGSGYEYVWTARGSTANTDLLIAGADGPTPTFAVPDRLDATTTYEYLLTASAENAESASGEVTVTVLNVGSLRVVCADPPSVYEGSDDFALDCSASGAPAGSDYAYAWTARGSYGSNTDGVRTIRFPADVIR